MQNQTLVGTIISSNFSGVQELARKLNFNSPQNEKEATDFFVYLRDNSSPQDFARYVMSVHPHWQMFNKNICRSMLEKDNNMQSKNSFSNACCGFVAADGSMQNGNNVTPQPQQTVSIMPQQTQDQQIQVPREVRQSFDYLSERISDIAATRNRNELVNYGIILAIGFILGKTLSK
jgi:hypothetical protein